MTVPALADHLVIATPDLDSAVDALADQIGVRPSPGGKHPGIATQNHLLSLSDSCYLEVIGPDPSQPAPDFPRPFGIDDLTEAKLVTWAIHVSDLEGRIESARASGYDPGEIMPLSRQSPDGLLDDVADALPTGEAWEVLDGLQEALAPRHRSLGRFKQSD